MLQCDGTTNQLNCTECTQKAESKKLSHIIYDQATDLHIKNNLGMKSWKSRSCDDVWKWIYEKVSIEIQAFFQIDGF